MRLDAIVTVGREAEDPIRLGMALATFASWARQARLGRVRVIGQSWGASAELWDLCARHGCVPSEVVQLDPVESQRGRHVQAAALATTDVYGICDSDIVLLPHLVVEDCGRPDPPWHEYVAGLLRDRPKYAMLSALPEPGGMRPPMGGTDGHVWQVQNTGGIRFVRRGVVTPDAPPRHPDGGGGYDRDLCYWLDSRGWSVGYAIRLLAVHLGYGTSSVWRDDPEGAVDWREPEGRRL